MRHVRTYWFGGEMLNQKTIIAKELIGSNRLNEAESILLGLDDKFSLFELAKLRRIQGRNKEAEQLYLKSLSVQPEIKYPIESDINIELGRIYAGFGNAKEAQKRYTKGLDRICLEKNIYGELGELYLSLRKYKEAEENLEKSIKLFPNDIKTNLNLAVVYRKLLKDEKTKQILNKLLLNKEVKNNKFLYNKVLNEYEIIMKREVLESKPREMRVTLTNNCNIGCRYCDLWKDSSWTLPEERLKEIINSFPYIENMYWLGGETFLYKGFEEVLEEGSKYDALNQTILTNGLLLNEKILEKIAKSNVSLIIAVDAGKKETYEYLRRGASWDKLCKNLELIKEMNRKTNKKIYTTFNAVISKSNYKEVFEMVDMAYKYDFNRIRFMSMLGNGDENIWLNKDMKAIEYLREAMPLVEARAKEYNIYAETEKFSLGVYKDINLKFIKDNKVTDLIARKTTKIEGHCSFPWISVVIDSKGPMRLCVNCNDWLGDSNKQTINEFWNCEGMQIYRNRLAHSYTCYAGTDVQEGPNDTAYPCCQDLHNPNICHMGW